MAVPSDRVFRGFDRFGKMALVFALVRGPRYIRGQLAIQHARQRQKLNEEHQLTKRRDRRIVIPSDLNTPAGCLYAQRLDNAASLVTLCFDSPIW